MGDDCNYKTETVLQMPSRCSAANTLIRLSGKSLLSLETGAGKGARTLDLNLGKVALYQLSYSRILLLYINAPHTC
jgi:hypothetical protein